MPLSLALELFINKFAALIEILLSYALLNWVKVFKKFMVVDKITIRQRNALNNSLFLPFSLQFAPQNEELNIVDTASSFEVNLWKRDRYIVHLLSTESLILMPFRLLFLKLVSWIAVQASVPVGDLSYNVVQSLFGKLRLRMLLCNLHWDWETADSAVNGTAQ